MTDINDREKLIRELQELGNIVDPNNDTNEKNHSSQNEKIIDSCNENTSLKETNRSESKNVTATETIDIFSEQKDSNRLDNDEYRNNTNYEFKEKSSQPKSFTDSLQQADVNELVNSETEDDRIKQLVSELLEVVEKRLSLHSGESLSDELRDDLQKKIFDTLVPWMYK